jgi:hypothetical protein
MTEKNGNREVNEMSGKTTDRTGSSGAARFFDLGQGGTEPMATLQRELLEAYAQASRAWLARVQSEIDLWSGLAAKLPAARSVPEALQAYQECLAQRMQMAAEDGQRLLDDCQKITQKLTHSLSNGWPRGST